MFQHTHNNIFKIRYILFKRRVQQILEEIVNTIIEKERKGNFRK